MKRGGTRSMEMAFAALLAVFLHFSPISHSLEISPKDEVIILNASSSFSVTCYGQKVTWKHSLQNLTGVQVKNGPSNSTLTLENVKWNHTGIYTCVESGTGSTQEISVFVPDSEVWFLPSEYNMVTKTSNEGTIPCMVTNPRINVTLYDKAGGMPLDAEYSPLKGFTAALDDVTYVCKGELDGKEKESALFYVFTIMVPPDDIEPYINASKTVLKQGEPLTVNCTIHGVELVYFSWDYPHQEDEVIEPLTDVLSTTSMRSCLIIPNTTLENSGEYMCHVHESVGDQMASDAIFIKVLDQGFVELSSPHSENVSAQLHESIEISVLIDAYPKPMVQWTKDNRDLDEDTITIETRQLNETRYISMLTLVRVRMEQRGLYAVEVSNEDAIKEMTFDLEVKVPPEIMGLYDHHLADKKHSVVCVAEGVPSPRIQWYSCDSMQKCSNKTTPWQPLLEDPENIKIQNNMSYNESRKISQARSTVTFQSLQKIILVRCEASNERGRKEWDIKLLPHTLFSQVAVLAAILSLVVIAVIFIIILIALWRKKPRYEIRWKVIESVSSDGHEYIYVDPIQLPYDSAWEVPRDSLILGRTLGSGAFGRVVEATAYGLGHSQSTTKVAVKMLKSTARRSETQALMSELKIMSHLGPHLNIVNLLGACTKHGPIYLVTEYCRYGDLVDYLHRNKHTFLQYYADKSRRDTDMCGDSMPGGQGKG